MQILKSTGNYLMLHPPKSITTKLIKNLIPPLVFRLSLSTYSVSPNHVRFRLSQVAQFLLQIWKKFNFY